MKKRFLSVFSVVALRNLCVLGFLCMIAVVGEVSAKKILPSQDNAYVNLVSEGKGTVTVRCMGYGNDPAVAQQDAEMRTVRALLFTGLPNASKYGALVEGGDEAGEHAEYFKALIEGRKYKKVISSAVSKGVLAKVKGEKLKSMPFDITVNYAALRRDLEVNNVIRKFGF